jgi:hypothetical protein
MTPLVRKRGKLSRPSGQWQDEDYDVLADGKVIGRILESGSRFDPPGLQWTWSITSIVPASRATHGTAATLEDDPSDPSCSTEAGGPSSPALFTRISTRPTLEIAASICSPSVTSTLFKFDSVMLRRSHVPVPDLSA